MKWEDIMGTPKPGPAMTWEDVERQRADIAVAACARALVMAILNRIALNRKPPPSSKIIQHTAKNAVLLVLEPLRKAEREKGSP